jgi:hypothetical protein
MRRLFSILFIAGGLAVWSGAAAAEPLTSVRVIVTFHKPLE